MTGHGVDPEYIIKRTSEFRLSEEEKQTQRDIAFLFCHITHFDLSRHIRKRARSANHDIFLGEVGSAGVREYEKTTFSVRYKIYRSQNTTKRTQNTSQSFSIFVPTPPTMTDRARISTASSGLRPLALFPHRSFARHNALEEKYTQPKKALTIAEEAANRAMNTVYEVLPSVETLDGKTCNLFAYVHRIPISLAISRMIDDINSKAYLSHPTSRVHTSLDQPISDTEYQIPPDLSWRSYAKRREGIESGSYHHFLDREESLANQRAHGLRDHLRDVETILTKREIEFVLKHNMISENPSLFSPRSANRVPFIRMDISKEGAAALTGDPGKLFEELCSWRDSYEGEGSGNE